MSHHNPHILALTQSLTSQEDLETKLNKLHQYKNEQTSQIKALFLKDPSLLQSVTQKLSYLAEAILQASSIVAQLELARSYGLPSCQDSDGNFISSEFAMIGMGKLGGSELHFSSDLDLIFVFSRQGNTRGRKVISNQEYFAKLAQRIISYVSLHTRYGSPYRVDTELRPSGQAGSLVTCIDTWMSYYHQFAAIWERQALLKARLCFANHDFKKDFQGLFSHLIFIKPFPSDLNQEIHHLRDRIEKELAKETAKKWHFKKGMGGIVDIEFIVQFIQLKMGKMFPDLLCPNTLDAITQLEKRQLLPEKKMTFLREAYTFYRMLEIYLDLNFDLREGYLNIDHECIPSLAKLMSFENGDEFLNYFDLIRREVRATYLETLKI